MKTTQKTEAEKTIVKFHITRGGRYNNAGHLYFKGFSRIDEGTSYEELFLNDETQEFQDECANEVGLTVEEADSGIGYINQDNEYDTTYTTFISDISEKELSTIKRDNHWESERAIELLTKHFECSEEDIEDKINYEF